VAPGPSHSLGPRAEPGKEDVLLRIASAYEAVSKRRIPPPAFGPLSDAEQELPEPRHSTIASGAVM
jgi:hypothetical protein